MTNLRQQLIAMKFKPVDGGYLYRAPYQIGIGKVRTYFVNEEQKAALVDATIAKRPWVRQSLFAGAFVAATFLSALAIFALSPHGKPTAADKFALIALLAALALAGFLAVRWWTLRRVKPILDRLPQTDQKFSMAEQRATMIKTMSSKRLAFVTGAAALNAVLMFYVTAGSSTVNSYISVFSACLWLGVAVYYGWKFIGRARSVQA